MNIISGYQIQGNISNSLSSVVYKVIQINNQQPVILKLLPRDYPSADELMRYRREYEMIRRCDADEIIKAYRLAQGFIWSQPVDVETIRLRLQAPEFEQPDE